MTVMRPEGGREGRREGGREGGVIQIKGCRKKTDNRK